MRSSIFCAVLVAGLIAAVCAQNSPIVDELVARMKSQMDMNANPCEDFYQYSCGKFLKENPVPKNITYPYINFPAFDAVQTHVDELLLRMVQQPWPYVNDFFLACNQPGYVYEKMFERTFTEFANSIEHANISTIEARMKFVFDIRKHPGDAFIFIIPFEPYLIVYTAGYWLPYQEFQKKGDAYKQHLVEVAKVLMRFENASEATKHAKEVADIEEYIAYSAWIANNGNSVDPLMKSVAEATEETKIDFSAYFSVFGVNVSRSQQLAFSPDNYWYFKNLTKYIGDIPETTFRRYFQYISYAQMVQWNQTQYAWQDQPAAQAPYCSKLTAQYLGDLIGMIFTAEVLTDDIVNSIRNMTNGIQSAFNSSLDVLPWLDKKGLEAVRFKLANIIQIIGHPNRIEKYSGLTTSDENLFVDIMSTSYADIAWLIQTTVAPANRSDGTFDPLLVNAFYDPTSNTINFPAAILESPVFSSSWPKLFQYARLGYIVGHENTHGFDNQGSLYNAYGNYSDIFDAITRIRYNNNSMCIVDFYDKYIAYGNQSLNGTNTLGENIADIGGLKNSYRAYQNFIAKNGREFLDGALIPGLSTEQVFFLDFGQTWCSASNEAWEEFVFENDVHSPSRYRVNGPVSQFDAFAKAFNCPAGSKMNPSTRCDLW